MVLQPASMETAECVEGRGGQRKWEWEWEGEWKWESGKTQFWKQDDGSRPARPSLLARARSGGTGVSISIHVASPPNAYNNLLFSCVIANLRCRRPVLERARHLTRYLTFYLPIYTCRIEVCVSACVS